MLFLDPDDFGLFMFLLPVVQKDNKFRFLLVVDVKYIMNLFLIKNTFVVHKCKIIILFSK
jgi:hypothetical protein